MRRAGRQSSPTAPPVSTTSRSNSPPAAENPSCACVSRPRPAKSRSPATPNGASSRPSPRPMKRSPSARYANRPQPATRPSAPSSTSSSGRGVCGMTPRAGTVSSQASSKRTRRTPRGSRFPPLTHRGWRRNRLREPPPTGRQPIAAGATKGRSEAQPPRRSPTCRRRPTPRRNVFETTRQSGKSTPLSRETIRETRGQSMCETTPGSTLRHSLLQYVCHLSSPWLKETR